MAARLPHPETHFADFIRALETAEGLEPKLLNLSTRRESGHINFNQLRRLYRTGECCMIQSPLIDTWDMLQPYVTRTELFMRGEFIDDISEIKEVVKSVNKSYTVLTKSFILGENCNSNSYR